MDKHILNQYIDACALIEEVEEDIRKLKKKKKTIVQTNVSEVIQTFRTIHSISKSREQPLPSGRILSSGWKRSCWIRERQMLRK